MGRFHLVYYISMGTPSIEASLQMAETYLAHGVSALQFDLPSRNPYRETLFIRKRMAKAWETYGAHQPLQKKMRLVSTSRIFFWVSLPLVAPPFSD